MVKLAQQGLRACLFDALTPVCSRAIMRASLMQGGSMARSVKGYKLARHLAFMSRMGGDVERMPPRARKTYLKRRLQVIEAQIRALSDRLDAQSGDTGHRWAVFQEPFDDDRWAVLASLDYLISARQALKMTIATL